MVKATGLALGFAGMAVVLFLGISPSFAQSDVIKYRRIFEVEPDRKLRFEVDIDAADVTIARNDIDDEISIFLLFTEEAFEYDFDYNERRNLLSMEFRKTNWIKSDSRDLKAEIEIRLPSAARLDFYAKIKAGEVDMELGDLTFQRFETSIWAGEVNIDFDAPNRIPMKWFELRTKIGSTAIKRLGNARFRFAEINSGIGELEIDFSGKMEDDATARVDLDVGETRIFLPDEVGTKLYVRKFLFLSGIDLLGFEHYGGKMYLSENYDLVRKKIELHVRPGIGELSIRYR